MLGLQSTDELSRIEWLVEHGRRILLDVPVGAGLPSNLRLEEWQSRMLRDQLQWQWRSRYRFPLIRDWIWTDRSLSQASDYWSAKYKASLFPTSERVADGCCGAGADLVALAERGEVHGFDADPALTLLAANNAKHQGFSASTTVCEIDDRWLPPADWLHIDPDRRPAGRRTLDSDLFQPSLESILHVCERVRGAIVKLAPSTQFNPLWEERLCIDTQRLWLGNMGECRQQLLLTGELRRSPEHHRRALLCEPGIRAEPGGEYTLEEYSPADKSVGTQLSLATTQNPCHFVYDLHNVLLAADLAPNWAYEHDLHLLGSEHGYYTGNQLLLSPWAQAFRVLDVVSFDDRKLRKWFHKFGAGEVEVKCRLHKLDANAVQRRYSRPGGKAVTLLVTRLEGRVRGILACRA